MSLDTCFVLPQGHNVQLLGGWWYAQDAGADMIALPTSSAYHLPGSMHDKKANARLDLELIRVVGRQLLGEPSGVRLPKDPGCLPAVGAWLQQATTGSALTDYVNWQQALGSRKFTEWDVTANQVYQEGV